MIPTNALGTSWNKAIHVAGSSGFKEAWKSLLDGTTQTGTNTTEDNGIDTRPAHLRDDCFRTALPFSFTAADSSVDYCA